MAVRASEGGMVMVVMVVEVRTMAAEVTARVVAVMWEAVEGMAEMVVTVL